jgi:hypothetical protein
MASLIPNILPKDPHTQIYLVGITLVILIAIIFAVTLPSAKDDEQDPSTFKSFLRFFYASFLKPHTGDGTGNGQQDALESFYKAQASVYDATRKRLLHGREDMLGLVAAQLVNKAAKERTHDPKRIWVDVSVLARLHDFQADLLQDWRRDGMEYRSNVRVCFRSRLLLERLPRRLLALTLRSSSQTLHQIGMDKCEGCLPRCSDLSSRRS